MGVNNKHVYDVIIGESYNAIGGDLDTNTLSAGQITVINPETRVLSVDNAANVFMQFAQADTEIGYRLSRPIKRKNIVNYNYTKYTAPRLQVTTVTMPTPVAGQEYVLHIQPRSIKAHRSLRGSYSVIAATGETSTTLAAKFAALMVNAGLSNPLVNATSAAAVLRLEAKSVGIYFSVGADEALIGATQTQVTTPFAGNGTFDEVRNLEITGKGYRGHVNRVKYVDPVNYYSNNTPNVPALTSPATVAVTNGSPVVTGNFSASQTALGRAIAVGDILRITSVTTDTYRVIAITGSTSITLDKNFTGTTNGTLAIAGVLAETLYDVYTIDHDSEINGIDEIYRPHITTIVAIKQNGANAAAFKTLLDALATY